MSTDLRALQLLSVINTNEFESYNQPPGSKHLRANRVQDLHQEKRNLCCKYARNQKNFNLPKQRGLSVKRELSIATIHHHCHHSITFYLPIGFHTSHLAMLLLPLPGLNCTFLCAAKCSNTKALQSVLLPCPGTGSSNRSFSAAVPTLAPQTTLC